MFFTLFAVVLYIFGMVHRQKHEYSGNAFNTLISVNDMR